MDTMSGVPKGEGSALAVAGGEKEGSRGSGGGILGVHGLEGGVPQEGRGWFDHRGRLGVRV